MHHNAQQSHCYTDLMLQLEIVLRSIKQLCSVRLYPLLSVPEAAAVIKNFILLRKFSPKLKNPSLTSCSGLSRALIFPVFLSWTSSTSAEEGTPDHSCCYYLFICPKSLQACLSPSSPQIAWNRCSGCVLLSVLPVLLRRPCCLLCTTGKGFGRAMNPKAHPQ